MVVRLLRPSICLSWSMIQNRVSVASIHSSSMLSNENIINIQDSEDFTDRVLGSKKPVIVDFHANWCGPCKILGPRLEALVTGGQGLAIMAKVDIDDNPDLAIDHGVQAVPTVLAMKDGKVVDKFVGLKDDTDLDVFFRKLVGK